MIVRFCLRMIILVIFATLGSIGFARSLAALNSVRAYAFRFALNLRHCLTQPALRVCASRRQSSPLIDAFNARQGNQTEQVSDNQTP